MENRRPLSFPLGLGAGDPLQLFFPPQMRFLLFFVVVFEKQPTVSHPHATAPQAGSGSRAKAGTQGPLGREGSPLEGVLETALEHTAFLLVNRDTAPHRSFLHHDPDLSGWPCMEEKERECS